MKKFNLIPTTFLKKTVVFSLVTVCLSSFLPLQGVAQGDLMIMPKRLVFEGRKKAGELSLVNTGKDTARYEITLVHYHMKEDGTMVELKGSDSTFLKADKFIRFFPRSVVLAPNEAQTVRMQVINSGKMTDGEYRSHFYFRAVPNPDPHAYKPGKKDSTAITFRLKPIFGISVPVIIKVGESTAKAGLDNASFENKAGKAPLVKATLTRTGNMSLYGDITVDYISPDGVVTKVAAVKGIAVYTPIEQRHVKIPLNTITGVDYSKGKLHVVYQAQENVNQNNIAQSEVYLH